MIASGFECSDGLDKDQTVQWLDGSNSDVKFTQCVDACLADPRCNKAGMGQIEYGLVPGRCSKPDACKCYLVIGECTAPRAHRDYSIYQLTAPDNVIDHVLSSTRGELQLGHNIT